MENGAEVKEFNPATIRSVSLNIQDDDGFANNENDEQEGGGSEATSNNVKISFHLSLDQSGQSVESRTKKFLESDDAIISQIFSQTITSAGVTPTDDYDEFFNENSQNAKIQKEKVIEEEENEDDHMKSEEDFEEENEETSQKLQILNAQQRPSIVIDCFDETPPVTPDEPTPGTGAFYFHQTIVDEDEDDVDSAQGPESGVESQGCIEDEDDEDEEENDIQPEIPSELLEAVEKYGITDNFTTIEEDAEEEDLLSPETEQEEKTEVEQSDNISVNNNNNNNEHEQPEEEEQMIIEPALQSDNLIECADSTISSSTSAAAAAEAGETSTDNNDIESDDDDDSAENNITAKAYSFDDEACIPLI